MLVVLVEFPAASAFVGSCVAGATLALGGMKACGGKLLSTWSATWKGEVESVALYQPLNGWDAGIKLAIDADTTFTDASEMFGVSFEENYNTQRRKQLGTRSPDYMPGTYEASGKATGYLITGTMATKLFGVPDTTAKRDHAARGPTQFNLHIDFSDFPITVLAGATPVKLVGYILSGCLMDTFGFELTEGVYIEQPLTFNIRNIYDVYDTDAPTAWEPFII